MRIMKSLVLSAFIVVGGCKNAPQLRQPGAVISLYQKDGGPAYETSPGTYNSALVDKFFESRPDILDAFVNHGVCSQVTDTASDEATQNNMICQSATSASMTRTMKKYQDANK